MESKHRDILQRRLPEIRRDLRVTHVVNKLIERGILLLSMKQEVLKQELTHEERADELIDLLQTRGPTAFPVFCEILQETYPHLADLLQEESDASQPKPTLPGGSVPATAVASTSHIEGSVVPASSPIQQPIRRGPSLFIIHAGEDKKSFVRPLHKALLGQNLHEEEIFFDEVSINTGENISEKIMSTLESESLKLVTIVISNHLLDKYWPRLEYEKSLFHQKKFYPIWLDQNTDNFETFSKKVGNRFPLLKKTRAHRIQYDNIAEDITEVAVKIVQLLSDQGYPGTKRKRQSMEVFGRNKDLAKVPRPTYGAAADSEEDTPNISIPTEAPTTIGLDVNKDKPPSTALQEAGFDFDEKQGKEGCEKMTPLQATKPPGEQQELKDIPMRDYQMELAIPALEGRNTIICAPTGSGKTRVAIKITRDHLEGGAAFVAAGVDARRRVVFLLNKVPLVEQQYNAFREYLSPKYDILPLSGETTADIPVGETLPDYDVIILTAQVLENALRDELITLDTFSMLIFDECHHCQKNDPYNAIMTRYIKQKVEQSSSARLPQIIGLTASLGVGKAKSQKEAVEHILGACANLDAEWISQVVEHKDELQKYNQKPEEEVKPVSGRSEDPFAERVNMIMEDIENTMAIEASKHLTKAELKPPRQREKQAYEQWVVTLARKGAIITEDDKVSRAIHAATEHLRKYFDALAINADARTKDALQYLEKFVTDLQKEGFDGTDEDLVKHFTGAKEYLQDYAADPKYSNPKLDELKNMILQAYAETPDSRCLLFCKTRALTIALLTWMQEDPDLRKLNPGRLVGAGASESTGGMTQNQQVELLELFNTGGHKIVISTSVAEEGIDIAKCNFVFRYDYVGNEIGKVQTRGRGRAEGSKSVLIAGREGGNVLKEKLNTIREKLMEKAMLQVWHMQREKHDDFMREVRRLQEESKKERDLAQALTEMQRKTKKIRGKGMKLLCVKCKEFACNVSDFRKVKENHHVVVDKTFPQRIIIKPHPPKKIDDWEKNGKVYCSNCRQDWGIQMVYRQASFPTLKIESFVIEKSDGQRLTCRKWKNAPFYVKDITPDDISGMLGTPEEEEEDEPMFD